MFKRIFNISLALTALIGVCYLGEATIHNVDVVQTEIQTLTQVQ